MEDPTTTLALIERRLSELESGDPQLASPLAFYRKLLPVLRRAAPLAEAVGLEPGAAQSLVDAGRPLLAERTVTIAPEPAQIFFRQVCEVLSEFQPSTQEALRALENRRLDLPSLLADLFAGRLEPVEPAAEAAEVSPVLLRMLLEYTLRPTLRSWAARYQDQLSYEKWQKTRCPVCGNPPLLSEILGPQRTRLLRCGICGAAWPYPRLQCAFCGNADPHTQSILSEDGEEKVIYAHNCARCKGYIKCLYTREPLLVDLLAVEDLVTLYLDQGCQERGYTRQPAL